MLSHVRRAYRGCRCEVLKLLSEITENDAQRKIYLSDLGTARLPQSCDDNVPVEQIVGYY